MGVKQTLAKPTLVVDVLMIHIESWNQCLRGQRAQHIVTVCERTVPILTSCPGRREEERDGGWVGGCGGLNWGIAE